MRTPRKTPGELRLLCVRARPIRFVEKLYLETALDLRHSDIRNDILNEAEILVEDGMRGENTSTGSL